MGLQKTKAPKLSAKIKYSLAASLDRQIDRENGQLRIKDLSTQVQTPHQRINYASHLRYYRDGSKKDIQPLYGWELEIERAPKFSLLKRALDMTLGKDQYYCCTDGSLRDSGVEIVSLPFTRYEWAHRYSQLHKCLASLSKMGCRSHDVDTCGLHIAVSGDILPFGVWSRISEFLMMNESFFKKISRRNNFNYCNFVDCGSSKYRALNLSHFPEYSGNGRTDTDRGEFRFFRGTLKPRSFLASLECIFAITEFFLDKHRRLGDRIVTSNRAMGDLTQFKKFIKKGNFPNLQDYLYEMNQLETHSGRESAKKLELERREKRELKLAMSVNEFALGGLVRTSRTGLRQPEQQMSRPEQLERVYHEAREIYQNPVIPNVQRRIASLFLHFGLNATERHSIYARLACGTNFIAEIESRLPTLGIPYRDWVATYIDPAQLVNEPLSYSPVEELLRPVDEDDLNF